MTDYVGGEPQVRARCLGERILIESENSGLHLLVWFPDLKARGMPLLVQAAESAGLGIYPVTPYFIGDPPMAGFVLGYASLEETQIRGGVGLLARAQ